MSLIIKDKINKFIVGYPTVSDKYNVSGATLVGDTAVNFGDLVMFSATKGYFEKAANIDAANKLAGFVVATNVKLNLTWPEGDIKVQSGEAFNLLVDGFIAIALDNTAVEASVIPNAPVYCTAAGKCTTVSAGNVLIPNAVFTGEVEKHGDIVVAEIYVK